jgi:hypothetical protein
LSKSCHKVVKMLKFYQKVVIKCQKILKKLSQKVVKKLSKTLIFAKVWKMEESDEKKLKFEKGRKKERKILGLP